MLPPEKAIKAYKILQDQEKNIARFPALRSFSHSLSIVIPVWVPERRDGDLNLYQMTRDCVESIIKGTRLDYQIIFIDNASEPRTRDWMKSLESKNVRVIRNETNLGVAKSWNQGMMLATGKYICIANNDTLISDGWDVPLIRAMEKNTFIGIASPANLSDGHTKWADLDWATPADMYCTKMEMWKDWRNLWPKLQKVYIDKYKNYWDGALRASWFVVRREMIEQVGGLDNRFGLAYYEDSEWMMRIMMRDWIFFTPHNSVFWHYMGMSGIMAFERQGDILDKHGKLHEDTWGEVKEAIYSDWLERQTELKKKVVL